MAYGCVQMCIYRYRKGSSPFLLVFVVSLFRGIRLPPSKKFDIIAPRLRAGYPYDIQKRLVCLLLIVWNEFFACIQDSMIWMGLQGDFGDKMNVALYNLPVVN